MCYASVAVMPEGFDSRLPVLMQALDDFDEACCRGDLDWLRAHLSPHYTHNDASGVQRTVGFCLARAAEGRLEPHRSEIHDATTRIFGDVAVITGLCAEDAVVPSETGPGKTAAGKPGAGIAFTQVWRWDGVRWMREAYQATPVSPDALR